MVWVRQCLFCGAHNACTHERTARVVAALHGYQGTDSQHRKQLLMDDIVVTIFTYGPVDRVGVIRKMRVNDTLVKGPATGAWSVDLTKAMRGHKSAKYHGGTKHELPKLPRLTTGHLPEPKVL